RVHAVPASPGDPPRAGREELFRFRPDDVGKGDGAAGQPGPGPENLSRGPVHPAATGGDGEFGGDSRGSGRTLLQLGESGRGGAAGAGRKGRSATIKPQR